MHPFRFAVHASRADSGEAWIALARRAEELGYSALLVPDHLDQRLSPITALATAAAATRTLRIGPYVFANDYRHPLLMAREAATLDVVSNGRLELGLGAGWKTSDYRQLGFSYDPPKLRVERFMESLLLVRRLLAGETVTHSGTWYHLDGARVDPRPVQRPVPIHVGAGGPRMLRFAARHADIIGLIPQFSPTGRPMITDSGVEATARKVAAIREAAGDRFAQIEMNVFIADAGLAGSGRPLPETLVAASKSVATALVASPYVLYGTLGGLRDRLERHREQMALSYYAIPQRAMEAMGPLVAALGGR